MSEIKFYRGLKSNYSPEDHKDGLYFATDKKEIILNGQSYGCEIDDELLNNSTNPATGRSIYKAIQDMVSEAIANTAIGSKIVLAKKGNTYQVQLHDSRRSGEDSLLSETTGFIGGEGSMDMSGLSVQWLHGDLYVRAGQTTQVRFKYDVLNSSGLSTGTPGSAEIQIINSSNGILIDTLNISLEANKISSTDITEYLIDGSSITINITVRATTNKGEQVEQFSCRAYMVNLHLLDENVNIATATKKGELIKVPYVIEGSNVSKTIRCYLNGSLFDSKTATQGTFEIPTLNLSHGTHAVQIRAEYKVDEVTTIYSNSIYYGMIVVEEENKKPVIATRFEYEDGTIITGIPYINMEQYDSYTIPYAVYDPINTSAEVKFYSNDELVSVNNVLFTKDNFSYRYITFGNISSSIECGSTRYDYRINISQSTLMVDEPTDSLQLYLDAYGKSNNSDSKNSWTYKDVTSTFENVNFGGDGWINNALRLMNGGRVNINYQPFKSQLTGANNAFAFTIRFKVTNVINEDEVVVSCLDEYGTGFMITTQEAKFITNGGKVVSTKFASDEIYNIGFISYPKAVETSSNDTKINTSMIYLYVNGILSGAEQRDTADSIYQVNPKNITLSADNCTLDIYSIRAYNTQLTDEQVFSCYLIDLGDSQTFKSEYEQNDVLDFNSNISVSSIYGKIPYIIITGKQDDGQATLPYVAVINDKDPKYDVDSILYVDGANPQFNFYCTPGEKKKPQIRLQGTSSLAYPRKNYRIYTKDANLMVGCDAEGNGGTLAKKSKYSMSDTAAPVNCFCLKADFAESSSSHNTGMANMVQKVLTKAGDLTPAQKYVNTEAYPYEVRTTIEGHPCLLFYRAIESDTPIFAGKFNFNNDKSTEAVFGFLDIDGYHVDSEFTERMSELAEDSFIFPDTFTTVTDEDGKIYDKSALLGLLEGNPTECWEFKNNNNRMGIFKEADFDKKIIDDETGKEMYAWCQMWEARFPDEDGLNESFKEGVKPKYLMRVAKWLHSTDTLEPTNNPLPEAITYGLETFTEDTATYRAAKFKNELKDYFDVKFLCDYYILNDCTAGADQRVKNMMWGFWYDPDYSGPGDGILCYPIYYDNDTILGVRNDGSNVFYWDVNEESLDPQSNPEDKVYAFAGHDSVLWKNLRELCSEELAASYQRVRKDNMTNANMYYFFDDTQSGKFCEKIYNKDALYKYVIPKTQGVEVNADGATSVRIYNYTASAQGDRKAHRHWFISNRMDLFDAKYNAGNYPLSYIQIKGPNIVSVNGAQEFKATAARDYYFHVRSDEGMELHKQVKKGEEWNYTYDSDMSDGSTFYFTGCKWMSKLDLSNWKGASKLDIPNMPVLEELIIGNMVNVNQRLVASPVSNNTPLIKGLRINNYKSIPSFDLSLCRYLEYLDLRGCDSTTTVTFAEGGNISEVFYPKGLQKLILRALPKLTTDKMHFEDITTVRALRVENCAQINGMNLLSSIFHTENNNLKYVRITGLNITSNGNDLIEYYNANLGGITSEGVDTPDRCCLVGTYRLTTLLDDELFSELCAYFPELNIEQPKYTTFVFTNSESTPEKISNYDNQTGYEFGNDYKPSGYITKILEQRHSYMVKKVPEFNSSYAGPGTFAACQLDPKNSYLYLDGETQARLDGSDGDFCMYEPHYWYKGVNDFLHGKIYAFYSTLPQVPTVAKGTKFTFSQLIEKKKCAVNATDLYNTAESALFTENDYITYKYVFPKDHSFVRARVMGVASNKYGCIVCDAKGNTIRKYLGGTSTSTGMFNGSYLWFDIPSGADSIYFTVSSDSTYNDCGDVNTAGVTYRYALYLTPSMDIEDLEPDWVEHKASFIGKILSTPGDSGDSVSGFMTNDFYPTLGNKLTIPELCSTISQRGSGYAPFDYDAYREIFLLGYLKYGTTWLQNEVGQGRQADGTYGWSKVGRYFPATQPAVNYAKYGEQDTKATSVSNTDNSTGITREYPYVSIYAEEGASSVFPAVSTLMGYHQMISNGGTISSNDYINKTDRLLTTKTKRTLKVFSIMGGSSTMSSYKFARYIQGGRYLDILGVGENDTTYNDEKSGYCLTEMMEAATGSTAGYLVCGYQGNNQYTPDVAACLRITSGTSVNSSIDVNSLDRVLRVMIIPNNLIICSDYTNYKNSTSQN